MVYTQVVNSNLVLPVKEKYTMHDVNKLVNDSLFHPVNGHTLSVHDAMFIVKCSAIYHNTDYSQSIRDFAHKNNVYTGMFVGG